MARRTIAGGRAIVTGASSGIGREIALELARRGARLLLTARRTHRLEQVRDQIASLGLESHFIAGDIADAELRARIVADAQTRWGGLDMLVNSAGVGAVGPFAGAGPDRLRRIMEVNFFAPVETIRAALPLLRYGRQPIVVNIGSVLGRCAVPDKSEYCASKFALHGFSDALRAELASEMVDVLLVSPSTTQSEFFDRLLSGPAEQRASPRRGMTARAVARKTVLAMAAGRREIVLSTGGRLLVWLNRLAPSTTNALAARFGRSRQRAGGEDEQGE